MKLGFRELGFLWWWWFWWFLFVEIR